jgi:hypothetical protein
MSTEQFLIPSNGRVTILEFDHEWNVEGWASFGGFICHVSLWMSVNEGPPHVLFYEDASGKMNDCNGLGGWHFTDYLEVLPGDIVVLYYEAYGWANPPGGASFTVDWLVSDFLLRSGDGQELQQVTWCGIKELFARN